MAPPGGERPRDGAARHPNEEHARMQADEASALSLIYPDEFRLLSPSSAAPPASEEGGGGGGGGERSHGEDEDAIIYEHPIAYSVRLFSPSGCGGSASLRVEYPPRYPDPDSPPLLSLLREGSCNAAAWDGTMASCVDAVREAARGEVEMGTPCALTCVQAGRDFFEGVDEGEILAAATSADGNDAAGGIDLLDTLPRPVIGLILEWLRPSDLGGKLSVASKSLRRIVERRAERALRGIVPLRRDGGEDGNSGAESWDLPPLRVDGAVPREWELDLRRCREDLRPYNEKLWRARGTTEFDFLWRNRERRRGGPPDDCGASEWLVRDGLGRGGGCRRAAGEGDRRERPARRRWEEEFLVYNYARSGTPILPPSAGGGPAVKRFFLVRARIRSPDRAGHDLYLGVVLGGEGGFDDDPASFFDADPGWGLGAASPRSAFLSVLADGGGNLECNLGLTVDAASGKIEYGIPLGAYNGLPVYNNGKVDCAVVDYDASANSSMHLAVVGISLGRGREQADIHASVSFRECSEKEWEGKMVVPYNLL